MKIILKNLINVYYLLMIKMNFKKFGKLNLIVKFFTTVKFEYCVIICCSYNVLLNHVLLLHLSNFWIFFSFS